jgi:hypothetical protein
MYSPFAACFAASIWVEHQPDLAGILVKTAKCRAI